ncbi:MAG: glycosyltransferase family 2 protein [Hyphomicrobiales bacterium]|jgi:glycosyltransferase involved in cell wall biosynthesis|nr:glycosyltransferase family 2 protein [Hyphomicrobiales bacterium]
MFPVTCTIIARDEADRIERAIISVRGLVDEILVVDSGSVDDTVAVCRRLGATVVHHPWQGFGQQKRFAEDQARHDWILNLDADEWISEDLRFELAGLLAGEPPRGRTFRIRTRLVYPNCDRPSLLADCHNYVRLYHRGATRCRNSMTHDEVLPTEDVVQLRGDILHRSFRSVAHVMSKMVTYSNLQRQEYETLRDVSALRVFFEFPFQFCKYYFLRRHVFGGRAGFVYATALAYSRWMRLMIRAGW